MPSYVWTCDACGRAMTREYDMFSNHPAWLRCSCGGVARRDIGSEQRGEHRAVGREIWCGHNPHTSVGAEVDPSQIADENAFVKQHNIQGVAFALSDDGYSGEPRVTSRKGWKEYCERRGYYNKDGGYGDAAPGAGHVTPPREPSYYTIDPGAGTVVAHD